MASKTINIDINENDNIAIISNDLINSNQIIKSLIFIRETDSNNISSNEKNNYLTTFDVFYKINSVLLESFGGGSRIDKKFKHFSFNKLTLNMYKRFLEGIWMQIIEKCPGFDSVLYGNAPFTNLHLKTNSNEQPVLNELGNTVPAGKIFAYPIGYFVLAEVVKIAVSKGKSVEDTIDVIMTIIPTNIDEKPWVNIVWNPITHQIIEGKKEKDLLVRLLSISLNLEDVSKIYGLTQLYQYVTGDNKSPLPIIKWSGYINDEIDDGGVLCF